MTHFTRLTFAWSRPAYEIFYKTHLCLYHHMTHSTRKGQDCNNLFWGPNFNYNSGHWKSLMLGLTIMSVMILCCFSFFIIPMECCGHLNLQTKPRNMYLTNWKILNSSLDYSNWMADSIQAPSPGLQKKQSGFL